MCDIYMPEDVGKMFEHQQIVILGGSFMRGVYKDLVWLMNHPSMIPREVLGAKLEARFPDLKNASWKPENGPCDKQLLKVFDDTNRDFLLESRGLTAGRTYIEPRRYYNKEYNVTVHYVFVVRVFSDELESFLTGFEKTFGAPITTIIMNSTLWDFNRWGPLGPEEFKINLNKLLELIPKVLSNGEFIWLTCPMGSEELQSKGMNVPGLEFQCFTSRYNVVEANNVASQFVSKAGYGVVDIHYALQMQTFRRNPDGIHWDADSNRLVTNLLLTHISLWRDGEEGLPGRVTDSFALEVLKLKARVAREGNITDPEVEEKLAELENLPVIKSVELDKDKENENLSKDAHAIMARVQGLQNKQAQFSKREEYKTMSHLQMDGGPRLKDNRFHPYGNRPQRDVGITGCSVVNPAGVNGCSVVNPTVNGYSIVNPAVDNGQQIVQERNFTEDTVSPAFFSDFSNPAARRTQQNVTNFAEDENFDSPPAAPSFNPSAPVVTNDSFGRFDDDARRPLMSSVRESMSPADLSLYEQQQRAADMMLREDMIALRERDLDRIGGGAGMSSMGDGYSYINPMYVPMDNSPMITAPMEAMMPSPLELHRMNKMLKQRIIDYKIRNNFLPSDIEINEMKEIIKMQVLSPALNPFNDLGMSEQSYMSSIQGFSDQYQSNYANDTLRGALTRFGRGGGGSGRL